MRVETLILDADDRVDEVRRQFLKGLIGCSEGALADKRLAVRRFKKDDPLRASF